MTTFENTFIRGQSPSYSEDVISENGMSTLPIRDKRALTSNLMNHNLDYHSLPQKKLPRGRNTFVFWTLVALLFILTIGNLFLTITIIGVLRLGKGMQSLELVPDEETIKFFGITDLYRIYKKDGTIEGIIDYPVTITSDDSSVAINLLHRNCHSHNKITTNKNGTFFKRMDKFEVKDPVSGETIFTTHRPQYNIPKGASSLHAKIVSTSRITSPIGKPLKLHADGKITFRGSEGLSMESQSVHMQSEEESIFLKAINGSIVLSGTNGVFLEMENIPAINSEYGIRTGNIQYKICVCLCMPQGKLFRVPVPRVHNGKITCTHSNPNHDPCL